jgi:nucleoid-associated protein YgaU
VWLQILFLEVRLAEVMAYADIPINMRPTLIDMDGPKLPIVITAPAQALPAAAPAAAVSEAGAAGQAAAAPQQQAAAVAAAAAAAAAASVPVPAAAVTAVKHTQLDMIKTALLNSIKMLKQMSQSLGELSSSRTTLFHSAHAQSPSHIQEATQVHCRHLSATFHTWCMART